MAKQYKDLINNNRLWASEKKEKEPNYFSRLSLAQRPPFLYIGCSDSRMPLDTYTNTEPGELFVHRNIANQVSLTDINFLSVLEYAVNVLKVQHIIVCGHYHCGGIAAAYHGKVKGLVGNWTNPIRDLVLNYNSELNAIEDLDKRLDLLSELNVIQQVENLYKTNIVQHALQKCHAGFQIHAWVLDISTGLIKELELPMEAWKNKGLIPETVEEDPGKNENHEAHGV
ncbi:MAG: carbonic anhydrase [Bacteroidales bacterium]|nr:carbonic anhydrase [Bacteroidales bacterium]